jgi:hypothetical protein
MTALAPVPQIRLHRPILRRVQALVDQGRCDA